jgi:hypothetical protein
MAVDWALYHLRLIGTLHQQQTQTGFWFMRSEQSEDHDHALNCFNIIERFNARIMSYIKNWGNQQWVFQGLVCATMYPRFGPIVERGFETSQGDQVGECLPSFNAGLLSLRTGLGGRNHLGRTYYPGISEGDSTDSRLTISARSRLQSIGDALLAGFSTTSADNEFYYGVYSHVLGDQPLPAPAVGKYITPAGFQPITQTIARPVITTMRRRKIGHGI